MIPAEIEQTTFVITDQQDDHKCKAEFRVSDDIIKFKGFMKAYSISENNEENINNLPLLKQGEILKLIELSPQQHFTQPPARYNDATLIKALEEKGIGRPSTYAIILSTIQERNYVKKKEGKLIPTELGRLVNDYLVSKFPDLINIGFTARMEDELDRTTIISQND